MTTHDSHQAQLGGRPVALVTGTSTGIGAATATMLARAGWTVCAGVRRLSAGPSTPGSTSGAILPVKLDVTDPASIATALHEISDRLDGKPLTALVNNAGIGDLGPMATITDDELRAVFEVNVFGAVRLTQAALPLMRAGSRVVFIGSVGDRITMPFGGPLTSSKWALASIAEAFRLELHADRIAVTLIEPGSIHTPAVDKVEAAARRRSAALIDHNPELARRFEAAAQRAIENERHGSSPDVVARTVVRALTARHPKSRYLTGKHAHLLAALGVLPDPLFDRLRLGLFGQLDTQG